MLSLLGEEGLLIFELIDHDLMELKNRKTP